MILITNIMICAYHFSDEVRWFSTLTPGDVDSLAEKIIHSSPILPGVLATLIQVMILGSLS